MFDDTSSDDAVSAEFRDAIHGFVDVASVLNSYRGPGTGTLKGASLVLRLRGTPPRMLILSLTPGGMRKLTDGLNKVVEQQDRADRRAAKPPDD
jgi:hypothetical protein